MASGGHGATLVLAKWDSDQANANKLYFHWGTSYTNTSITITDTNWHHYIVTVEGTAVRLYVDGVIRQTVTAPANISPEGVYEIGRYIDGNIHYNTSQISINKI